MKALLALDTTGARCAAGVADGQGRLLAERVETLSRGHAERLFPLIEAALAEAGVAREALGLVAVCTGPGGFTGPRVGVAAARALALALGARAVGVDRFALLAAWEAAPARGLVALPAPQGRVFAQRLRDGRTIGEPALLAADDPALGLEPGEARLDETAVEAAGLGALARAALRAAAGAAPRPLYLRPPDAKPAAPAPPLLR